MVQVGAGKMDAADVKNLLERKDRQTAPSTAPPHGLFLTDVKHGDFKI